MSTHHAQIRWERWVDFSTGETGREVELTEVTCSGVDDSCAAWFECTVPQEHDDDQMWDDDLEAHGEEHQHIDGSWMVRSTPPQCLVLMDLQDWDQADCLISGTYELEWDCDLGSVYVTGMRLVRVSLERDPLVVDGLPFGLFIDGELVRHVEAAEFDRVGRQTGAWWSQGRSQFTAHVRGTVLVGRRLTQREALANLPSRGASSGGSVSSVSEEP